MAGLGLNGPGQQGGQDIPALTLGNRRKHLGSLGQVWEVNAYSFNNVYPDAQ
jgi:hypothetical protein